MANADPADHASVGKVSDGADQHPDCEGKELSQRLRYHIPYKRRPLQTLVYDQSSSAFNYLSLKRVGAVSTDTT